MDTAELREILQVYETRDPDFRAAGWHLPDDSAVVCGEVQRSSLLHTYRRRLKRVAEGTPLHAATQRLVDLLEGYGEAELNMISYRTPDGRFWLFLADREKSRILLWMSMFS
jgi:hypothetical protein